MTPTDQDQDVVGTTRLGYLIEGEDPSLVSQGLSSLVETLTHDQTAGPSAIEEYGAIGAEEDLALGPLLDACRTPPFLGDHRIVVLREANRLNASQIDDLAEYLKDPLDSTTLIVAYVGKSAPAALRRAIRTIGSVIDTAPPSGAKARSTWFSDRIRQSHVHLAGDATLTLQQHLGQDMARLEGILGSLEAAFGTQIIHAADLEPYLGSFGGVAPWDLTDAIDQGNIAAALVALDRMINGGERHPLQVLATLHRHFGAMLTLDGADVADASEAAALTRLSSFPAQKVLLQTRRLGHERVARAITLIAKADLDLRGQIGWPPELVLEVLVARLAQLQRLRKSGPSPRRGN